MSPNRRLIWDADSTRTMWLVAILLACLALIGSWGLVGLGVLGAEEPVSVRGIVACLAFTLVGMGAGVLAAGFAVWYARRRGRIPEPGSEHVWLFSLLLGLATVGSGMEYALPMAPTGWALFSVLFFSTGGGALIGFALVLGGRGVPVRRSGGVAAQGEPGPRAR
jgi:hypothetical protein